MQKNVNSGIVYEIYIIYLSRYILYIDQDIYYILIKGLIKIRLTILFMTYWSSGEISQL